MSEDNATEAYLATTKLFRNLTNTLYEARDRCKFAATQRDRAGWQATYDTAAAELRTILLTEGKVMYDNGMIISCPALAWAREHSELFARLVDDPLAYFYTLIDSPTIVSVVRECQLLTLIPEYERDAFVRAVCAKHYVLGDSWVELALNMGIARTTLAELVTAQIQHALQDPPNRETVLADFVVGRGGSRHYFSVRPVWAVLRTNLLHRLLRKCAKHAPKEFLAEQYFAGTLEQLKRRLPDERIAVILSDAARHLTSLSGVVTKTFAYLPRSAQHALIQRVRPGTFGPNMYLIFTDPDGAFALEHLPDTLQELWQLTQAFGLWQAFRGDVVRRQAWDARDRLIYAGVQQYPERATRVDKMFVELFRRHDRIVGTVEVGEQDGKPFVFVRHVDEFGREIIYVQHDWDMNYMAKPGDAVVVHRADVRNLPLVVSAYFQQL